MAAIKAEDLQGFVGGQWVRVDHKREFQGPVLGISDGDNGEVEITCTWEAEYDPKRGRCKTHNGSSVTHTVDLSHGALITDDGSEFYHNPHICTHAGTKDDPCRDPEHLAHTYHLYSPGSAMEVRIAGVEKQNKEDFLLRLV